MSTLELSVCLFFLLLLHIKGQNTYNTQYIVELPVVENLHFCTDSGRICISSTANQSIYFCFATDIKLDRCNAEHFFFLTTSLLKPNICYD